VQELQALIAPLIELCRTAGEAIRVHYHSAEAGEYEAKGDDSPLTQADLNSHAILQAGLESLVEGVPILSEESTAIPLSERLAWNRYWLVDPLDGTKEFLERTGEFTINVALIEDHRPILGILYLPLELKAYVGIPGKLAQCYQYEEGEEWSSRELRTRKLVSGEALTLLASRRHRGPRLSTCLEWLEQNWGSIRRQNSGSALKFCQLVDGEGDFYPRFSPCCEWDTAAGQALLEAAGGSLVGMDGSPLRYNCGESLLSPNFYAVGDPQHPLWGKIIAHGI
jgi:3'(2'), 5'-bisphosphate nucleotidase